MLCSPRPMNHRSLILRSWATAPVPSRRPLLQVPCSFSAPAPQVPITATHQPCRPPLAPATRLSLSTTRTSPPQSSSPTALSHIPAPLQTHSTIPPEAKTFCRQFELTMPYPYLTPSKAAMYRASVAIPALADITPLPACCCASSCLVSRLGVVWLCLLLLWSFV